MRRPVRAALCDRARAGVSQRRAWTMRCAFCACSAPRRTPARAREGPGGGLGFSGARCATYARGRL